MRSRNMTGPTTEIAAAATRRWSTSRPDNAALIVAGVKAGAFHVEDPRAATLAIGGMISWAYVWHRPGGRLTPEEIGVQMATYALRIVGADEAGY
jgi:hypothetical protein